jgi:hypothetical protein
MARTLRLLDEAFTEEGRDGASVLTRSYEVIESTGPITDTAATIAAMKLAGEIREVGETISGAAFSSATLYGTMRVRSIVGRLPGQNGDRMLLTIRADTLYAWREELEQPKLVPRRDVSYRTKPIRLYRSLADCTLPSGASATGTDIGGTKLDRRGRPLEQERSQAFVTVNARVDTTALSLGSQDGTLRSHIGKILSAAWMTYPAYTLRLVGLAITHERDEYWNARYELEFDPLFFWQQIPEVDADGEIKLTSGQANDVRWVRDYATADYSSVLAAYETHRAEKGEFVYP